MDPVMNTPDTTAGGSEAERSTLLIAYVLQALAPFNGLTGVISVIISHIKVKETQNAFIRSHHSWLIRTFWWGLLWSVISFALMWVVVGFVTYAIFAIWWLYRVVRGFMNYGEKKPMPG